MKILSIGTDRKVFESGTKVRSRIVGFGKVFEQFHYIVFSKKTSKKEISNQKVSENVFLYPTLSVSRFFYIRDAVRLGREIIGKEERSDDWTISAQDPFECGLAGYFLAKKYKLPLQLQVHTDLFSPYFGKLSLLNFIRVRIAKFLLPKADRVRVVSKRISDSIDEQGIVLKNKPYILPVYGGSEKEHSNAPAFNLRQKFGDHKTIILSVSRLSPEKDHKTALKALAILLKKGSDCVLVIVGEGETKTVLINLANKLGIRERVYIEPWQNNLSPYYEMCDVYLSTSTFEGFGLSMLEAVSYGKPLIATDAGIARELSGKYENDFICPVGEPEKISDSVYKLISNESQRVDYINHLKENGKKFDIGDLTSYLERYKKTLE